MKKVFGLTTLLFRSLLVSLSATAVLEKPLMEAVDTISFR